MSLALTHRPASMHEVASGGRMRLKSAGAGSVPNWPESGRFFGCRREDDRPRVH